MSSHDTHLADVDKAGLGGPHDIIVFPEQAPNTDHKQANSQRQDEGGHGVNEVA